MKDSINIERSATRRLTVPADVRQTIREEYDELPEVYDRRLWENKVERTFQFMFERYSGEIAAPPT
jgi:hypothetical protein